MKLTSWKSLTDTNGKELDWSLDKIAEWFTKPIDYRDKETPGWSAATFIGPQRRADRCTSVSALVLDFDDGKAPLDVVQTLFAGTHCLIHTSKSHTAENQSWRVLVELSRPVLPAEYATVWQAFTRPFSDRVDQAAKDASRFWFVPCKLPTTEYQTLVLDGEPVDVDSVLSAESERLEQIRKANQAARVASRSTGGRMPAQERASRYVSRMDPSLSGSGGHNALWAATVALVKGFGLARHEAESILVGEFNPRCQPPWSPKEIAHKLDNAEKARLSDGYLLGDDPGYEYRADPVVIPPCPPPPDAPATLSDPDGPDGIPWEPGCDEAPEPEAPKTAVERLGLISIQTLCLEVMTDVNKPRAAASCMTGVAELDAAIGGYRSGMVTVFGASTNFGKTTFSIMSADIAAKAGKIVIYCTFEDSPLLYGRRIVARRGHVNATRLRDGDISQDDRRQILRVAASAEKEPFLFNCIGKKAEWVCKSLVDISHEAHIDLVVLDYIQRCRVEQRTQDRRNEVTLAAELLTNTIKNIGASGLVLSQIRRLKDGEKPTMFDLKESGDIENMAEHIILGYKDGDTRKVFLDKNKDGPVFGADIDLRFDDVSASFIATNEMDGEAQMNRDDLYEGIMG